MTTGAKRIARKLSGLGWGASFSLLLLFGASTPAFGQGAGKRYRPPPDYPQFGVPDQQEGRHILQEFRQRGIAGDYFLEFQLRVMPRRGADRSVSGRLWGSRTEEGPLTRLAFNAANTSDPESRLLVQSGPAPKVWSWDARAPGEVKVLGLEALFAPLAGTDLTPFDLQMPFLYWSDFVFEGVRKVRGRPAHSFLLYPPSEFAEKRPELTGVRVFLDTQFNALVQAEQIGDNDRILKAMTVLDLKKVGEQWIVKSVDLRDEATRNKTRFSVTSAALSQNLGRAALSPGALTKSLPVPDRVTRVGP